MAGKIFINYRRGDDPGHTGRLFDRLQDVFRPEQLFLDVDNIAPGLDFVSVLNERVSECDVVLAVIGKGWVDARDATGNRRLDDPDDFVRIEIASALTQGKRVIPVLVGEAQMPRPEELPEVLRPIARRNAVRLTHERFRADTQGLVKALEQALQEIELLHRSEAEEEERQRQEVEAQRRAADEERRIKSEEEARERAAQERHRQKAVAEQRAEEERAFTAAKRANTVLALDAFLAAYSESTFVNEARSLKAVWLAREEAFHSTSASDNPAVLRTFLTTYKKGADVDQVRARLRLLARDQAWRPLKPAIIVPGALAAVATVAALAFWLEHTPVSTNQQVLAEPTATPLPNSFSAEPVARPSVAPAPLRQVEALSKPVPAPSAAPAPSPDEVAWSVLKDTTDAAALKRFTAQFPDSPLRMAAEARIAVLAAVQATKPAAPSAGQIAWDLVKDSKNPDELRRFVEQFPDSARRADAEQRIASLSAPAPNAASANTVDPHELAMLLQFELQRVGCFNGAVNGEFDEVTKTAWHRFIKLTSISMPDELSSGAIKAVRRFDNRVCPLICPAGERAKGELCVAVPPPQRRHPLARAALAREPTPKLVPQANARTRGLTGRGCRSPRKHRLAAGGCGY